MFLACPGGPRVLWPPKGGPHGVGFVLESRTWRANPDWAAKVGYARDRLAELNRAAIDLMHEVRTKCETVLAPIVISGNIGPRGDGYDPGALMTVEEATTYHAWQIGIFRGAGVDCVSAFTMTDVNEATGVARAALTADVPSVISFTLKTDGRLPTGEALGEAIEKVDRVTGNGPAYYMINCVHPTHFADVLDPGAPWAKRLRAVRANSSCKSHAELDNSPELDTAIRRSSARSMRICCAVSRTSTCSAAAVGPTTGTSPASARLAARLRNRRLLRPKGDPRCWRYCFAAFASVSFSL